jgi:hypothetical protein
MKLNNFFSAIFLNIPKLLFSNVYWKITGRIKKVKIKFKVNKIRLNVVKKENQSIISNCEKRWKAIKISLDCQWKGEKNIMI